MQEYIWYGCMNFQQKQKRTVKHDEAEKKGNQQHNKGWPYFQIAVLHKGPELEELIQSSIFIPPLAKFSSLLCKGLQWLKATKY